LPENTGFAHPLLWRHIQLPLLEPVRLFIVRILVLEHGVEFIVYLIFLELVE
jgi:hypothetical protein